MIWDMEELLNNKIYWGKLWQCSIYVNYVTQNTSKMIDWSFPIYFHMISFQTPMITQWGEHGEFLTRIVVRMSIGVSPIRGGQRKDK